MYGLVDDDANVVWRLYQCLVVVGGGDGAAVVVVFVEVVAGLDYVDTADERDFV